MRRAVLVLLALAFVGEAAYFFCSAPPRSVDLAAGGFCAVVALSFGWECYRDWRGWTDDDGA